MTKTKRWLPTLISFAIALLFGVALGSVVQTQFNLNALQGIGVEIPLAQRLETTLIDLVSFAPIYALLFSVGFILSQLAAIVLCKWLGGRFLALLSTGAAALGLLVSIKIVDAFAPMPTFIAATRGTLGLVAMLITAALAGWLFAVLKKRSERYSSAPKERNARGLYSVLLVGGVSGLITLVPPVQAQAEPSYHVATFADSLEYPWSLAFLPDGRLLVTERPGRLRLLGPDGDTQVASLSGMPAVYTGGNAGLFDLLISPDFETDQKIYFSYACGTHEANHTCLGTGTLADTSVENVTEIFRVQPSKKHFSHFGGRLAWLPDDTLILTLGDGFDYREQAQNLHNHIGSIVRLNQDGSVPDDNPFVGRDDARPEIYSYGHRNVQGLLFDTQHQRLIAHEHGPRGGDEINIIKPGANYGWPMATGGLDYNGAHITPYHTYPGTESALLEWTPSIAPSGMALYTGALFPQWQGDLFVGGLASRDVRRVHIDDEGTRATEVERLFGELGERIREVLMGPEGALYLLTDSPDGRVLRVTPQQ